MTRKIIGKSLDLTSVKAVIQETVINDNNENNDEEQENGYYPLMIHIGNSSLQFGIMRHNQFDRAFEWPQVVDSLK